MSVENVQINDEKKVKLKKVKGTPNAKNGWNKFLTLLQELGKTLQFPIAVLPFAAILNRFGALGIQFSTDGDVIKNQVGFWISTIIQIPGNVPFANLPLLFAIGCAFGLAKDHRGEVALVSVIFYLALTGLTAEKTLPQMIYGKLMTFEGEKGIFSKLLYVPIKENNVIKGGTYVFNIGVLGGIFSGCVSAYLYNRLKDIKLPTALAFFGGRRFVPMVALVTAIPTALAFSIIWPWIQLALISFGNKVADPTNPAIAIPGTTIYSILNRLLLPFGLHQILNTFFWFQMPLKGDIIKTITGEVIKQDQIVYGDINAFAKGLSTSGLFQSGFFPIMMGGLPMAAVAMIMAAKKENRKEVAGFLGGVAGVSFLSGITEPLEFSFVFIAPVLLGLHALLTGVFMAITTAMRIQVGFGFSAGFIDYAISFAQSWGLARQSANEGVRAVVANPLWILVLSAGAGAAYFFIFLFTIKGLKIATPGREDRVEGAVSSNDIQKNQKDEKNNSNKFDEMAQKIVAAIGEENFEGIDNCATRLRLILKDNSKVDDAAIKAAGTYGVKRLGNEGLQIVIGPNVEHVAEAIKKIVKK